MPTIQNYETALCDVLWYEPEHLDFCGLKFGGAFLNSLIIALVSTLLTLVIGCMAAYALVRFRFMGRDAASLTTLMVRMVPPAVLLVPVFGLWNNEFCLDKDGLIGGMIRDTFGGRGDVCLAGTHSGIILIYVAMNLPFVIWILQSFILQVPRSLEEAARVDGAGPMRFFWDIVVPMSRTNVAALFVILFIYGWNQYLWPLLITTDPEMNTIVMGIKQMFPSGDDVAEWPVIMATSILAMIPPVIGVVSMQRLFIRGLVDSEK
jgi:multiple sugar transport system permease protein